jgi:hypothetical protein
VDAPVVPDAGPDAPAVDGGCTECPRPIPSNVGTAVALDESSAAVDLTTAKPGHYVWNTTDGSIRFTGGAPVTIRGPGVGIVDGIGFHPITPAGALAVELGVFTVGSLRVRAGAELRGIGTRPLVILAAGDVLIDGRVVVGSNATERGAGAATGGMRGERGRGLGGGNPGAESGVGGDTGGAGGSFGQIGSHGGDAPPATGGTPAMPYGNVELTPLLAGSGGGGGSADDGGEGGAGGGAIQITSGTEIAVTGAGVVDASGAGGGGGSSTTEAEGSGAGGGSGGAILLEAPAVTLIGWAGANGGAGGGGAPCEGGGCPGERGENGWAIGMASGGGFTNAIGGAGGNGSNLTSFGGDGSDAANAGGAGGGSGRIRINTAAGTERYDTVSPEMDSGRTTVGVIRLD